MSPINSTMDAALCPYVVHSSFILYRLMKCATKAKRIRTSHMFVVIFFSLMPRTHTHNTNINEERIAFQCSFVFHVELNAFVLTDYHCPLLVIILQSESYYLYYYYCCRCCCTYIYIYIQCILHIAHVIRYSKMCFFSLFLSVRLCFGVSFLLWFHFKQISNRWLFCILLFVALTSDAHVFVYFIAFVHLVKTKEQNGRTHKIRTCFQRILFDFIYFVHRLVQ